MNDQKNFELLVSAELRKETGCADINSALEYIDRMENFILAHEFFCKWLDGKWSYEIARHQCAEEGIKLTRFHYLKNLLYCAYVYWKVRPAMVARMDK